MRAMDLTTLCDLANNQTPLNLMEMLEPIPVKGEVLVKVSACGVCHTELDEIEGRTPPPRLPIIPGHQVISRVVETGSGVETYTVGERVGVAWIYSTCGSCKFCQAGDENLCPHFLATGRDVNGGYAQYLTVHEHFTFRIPEHFIDAEVGPMMCAGAIGYRSLRLTGFKDGHNLGLTGFGASAHLVLKLARYLYPRSDIHVFCRDEGERAFAKELGAVWAGDIADELPIEMDAIIDTMPAWRPVVEALKNLKSGGWLVINAIRKEEIDKEYLQWMDYPTHLWMEKEIKRVANVSRKDVSEFLALAEAMGIQPEVQEFSLEEANRALIELESRKIRGAKVLRID